MFDLVEKNNLRPEHVKKLNVAMSKTAVDMHGIFPRYKGKFDALLSTHYAAAVILHDRELSLAQFEPARYDDAKLRRFAAEQVEVTCDPALSGVEAVVQAHTTDGKTLSMRCDHPARVRREPAHARSDRGEVPHLRQGAAARRQRKRSHRRGNEARGSRFHSHAHGPYARGRRTTIAPIGGGVRIQGLGGCVIQYRDLPGNGPVLGCN